MTTTITKKEMLRQVMLCRPTETGQAQDVCWIDNGLARVGNKVRSKENGLVWTVVEIYSAKEFADVDRMHRVWKDFAEVLDGH